MSRCVTNKWESRLGVDWLPCWGIVCVSVLLPCLYLWIFFCSQPSRIIVTHLACWLSLYLSLSFCMSVFLTISIHWDHSLRINQGHPGSVYQSGIFLLVWTSSQLHTCSSNILLYNENFDYCLCDRWNSTGQWPLFKETLYKGISYKMVLTIARVLILLPSFKHCLLWSDNFILSTCCSCLHSGFAFS